MVVDNGDNSFLFERSLEAVLDVSRVLATFEISKLLSKTRFSNGGAENNCQKKKKRTHCQERRGPVLLSPEQ